MLEESFKTIRNGEVVDGTVIDVKPDEIILNIGYKADGIITRNEYTNEANVDLTTVVSVGDKMSAKVLKVNDGEGQVLLTYKRLAAEKGNERLKEAFENHEVLKAPVTQILGGGLSVVVDEARVFIPASLVSDTYEKDLSKYQGQEIEFVISEFNPRRNRVIGDRRQLLVAERAEKQKELFAKINVGDRMEGTVKNVTDFGAFIDLGGVDGLLHISEMSWGRVENPKKVFQVGDKVEVMIKDIHDTKIALSLKFPETNPWANAAEDYAVGTVITGKVARMTDFGAFVELAPGVESIMLGGFVTPQVRAGIGDKFPVIYGKSYMRNNEGKIVVDQNGLPMQGEDAVIGTVSPDFRLGFNTNIELYKFRISAVFDWKQGGQMYSGTAGEMNYYGVSKLSGDMRKTDFIVENSVKETGKDTNGNPIYAPNDIKVSDAQSYFTRRRSIDESYIYDNSYIKLRELSISYPVLSKKWLNVNVNVFARNILVWSEFKGFDPEASQGNDNMGGAFERFSLPGTASYGFGFNVKF